MKEALWGSGRRKSKFKNCCYCELSIPSEEITREHIIPKSKGGRITAPCCLSCNREKADMLLITYILFLWTKSLKDPKAVRRNEVKVRNAIKLLLLLYPGDYDFIFK